MAYMISNECINCSACEYECPVRAIRAGASSFVIDAATCVECDGYFAVQRCRSVCPVGACQPSREVFLFRIAALAHRGAPPMRLQPAGATP